MYCEKCGTKIARGAKFCTSCGTPVGETTDRVIKLQPQNNQNKFTLPTIKPKENREKNKGTNQLLAKNFMEKLGNIFIAIGVIAFFVGFVLPNTARGSSVIQRLQFFEKYDFWGTSDNATAIFIPAIMIMYSGFFSILGSILYERAMIGISRDKINKGKVYYAILSILMMMGLLCSLAGLIWFLYAYGNASMAYGLGFGVIVLGSISILAGELCLGIGQLRQMGKALGIGI